MIEYLEQLPDNENESITANTFFISALYKQKELYTINDRNEPTNESAPLADIVLLDKNNAKFDVNYKYFISLGMKETKIDTIKRFIFRNRGTLPRKKGSCSMNRTP